MASASPRNPNLVFGSLICMYTDKTQDLVDIVIILSDCFKYRVNFRMISTGEEHPLGGSRLIVTGRALYNPVRTDDVLVTVRGNRLAIFGLVIPDYREKRRLLHIFNWH